jgi:hypothetical protein
MAERRLSGNSSQLVDSARWFFGNRCNMCDRPPGLSAADVRGARGYGIKFPRPMNDDVCRRGCSPETHPRSVAPGSSCPGRNLTPLRDAAGSGSAQTQESIAEQGSRRWSRFCVFFCRPARAVSPSVKGCVPCPRGRPRRHQPVAPWPLPAQP